MTITTVNDIANGLSTSQEIPFLKVGSAPKSIGAFHSLWMAAGQPGAGVASPAYTAGSGYTCDASTVGAFPYTGGAVKNYLAKWFLSSSLAGVWLLVDRLWSCSGMGFASGTYTVTTPGSLPARAGDGTKVYAIVEQFVAAGAASGTLTLNYLNQLGASKSGVIAAVVSAPAAGQVQMIPYQVGDKGISQVTSAVTSNTWTSGSFGITLVKPIAEITVDFAGGGRSLDWAMLGLPVIQSNTCLMLLQLASSTTGAVVKGSLDIIDK